MSIDNDTVSLKELREEFPRYIAAMKAGKSFTVLKRSKPIFRISPVGDDGEWQTIADFTEVKQSGIDAEELLKYL